MEEPAFARALVELRPKLLRYATRLTRQPADAEDLTQDTLCRALARRRQFRLGSNLSGWLHVIAVHIYVDNYRREHSVELHDRHSSAGSVEDQAIARVQLRGVLTDLDPAVAMVAIGLSGEEISRRMGLSIKTIHPRISRSRRRLRALVA